MFNNNLLSNLLLSLQSKIMKSIKYFENILNQIMKFCFILTISIDLLKLIVNELKI